MKSELKIISVEEIILDKENPRLAFAKIEKEVKAWTDKSMSEEIKETYVFNNLLNSIQEYGVMDPIWVQDLGNGKYTVIEGNMRVTVLKELITNNTNPPPGIDYNTVKAHVVSKETEKKDIDAQKAVLQTGKNPWGPFNEAAHIYDLFWKHKSTIDEIAVMLGRSVTSISHEIDNFKIYKEFIEFSRNNDLPIDPNKYSFVSDASNTIRTKFFQSKQSRKEYFKLITPNEEGITRIPSVSNRGGLKVFSKFVSDEKTLQYFLKNSTVTVDDAFEYFQEKSLPRKKAWVKKIPSLVKSMHKLNKFEREELLENSTTRIELRKLQDEVRKFFN